MGKDLPMPKYTVIWEFEVQPDKLAEFEQIYDSQGDWVQLFMRGKGFINTELVQNIETNNRYIVLDHWQSRTHYLLFREAFNQEYDAIDVKSRSLIIQEKLLGAFETVDTGHLKKRT
jgi:heme-degrading monooxygenase HmoA